MAAGADPTIAADILEDDNPNELLAVRDPDGWPLVHRLLDAADRLEGTRPALADRVLGSRELARLADPEGRTARRAAVRAAPRPDRMLRALGGHLKERWQPPEEKDGRSR